MNTYNPFKILLPTKKLLLAIIILSAVTIDTYAEVFFIESEAAFYEAQDIAAANDSIIWRSGVYGNVYMIISKDNLYIGAEELGSVVFNGSSRVRSTADYLTFEGFQYVGGDIGSDDVIEIRGDNNLITQINIREYTSYKYLRVREESQFVEISNCNFENRLNLDDQNILSILVDNDTPGYHKIRYCSFKNFEGTGNDLGIEPIRIGLSSQSNRISRTVVEYCYFTECDGDGELISSKATQNVYRHNTFENNSKAELVLRHGSEAIIYGNFFLNGKGGVRVREGQDHYIYNNYFYQLDDRAIYLQNEDSDPLDNINIAFNTIIECAETRLGGSGSDQPTNVVFANNIFSDPDDDLFEDETGTETWLGNISFGDLGISVPSSGMIEVDPLIESNSAGFFGLMQGSPAIDAAFAGFKSLPQFMGVDDIDIEIGFDLMGQVRPTSLNAKDLGCNEFPHNTIIQPIATEENTGPFYNTLAASGVSDNLSYVNNLFDIYPNPIIDEFYIKIENPDKSDITIEIIDTTGKLISKIDRPNAISDTVMISENLKRVAPGTYVIKVTRKRTSDNYKSTQSRKFIKIPK